MVIAQVADAQWRQATRLHAGRFRHPLPSNSSCGWGFFFFLVLLLEKK